MMELSFNLGDLEIIGYADRLSEAFVPQVVPPIFRVRADPDRVVMPPFRIEEGQVAEAKAGLVSDFERAVTRGQATRLEENIAACPGYRLWIDEKLQPHYAPAAVVAETLLRLAHSKAREAQSALAQGRLHEASRLAQSAISADDGCLNAILVKALVHRLEGDQDSVDILTEIAGMVVPGADFQAWIDFFAALVLGRLERKTHTPATSQASFVAESTSSNDAHYSSSDWRGVGGWIEEEEPYSTGRVADALISSFSLLSELELGSTGEDCL